MFKSQINHLTWQPAGSEIHHRAIMHFGTGSLVEWRRHAQAEDDARNEIIRQIWLQLSQDLTHL